MARAFTSADVVQSASGQVALATDPGVALPNPAAEGNGGVIVLGSGTQAAVPDQWHLAAVGGAGSALVLMIMCRADLPAGDQSWSFPALAGNVNWCWVAEEWTNLSFAPLATSARTSGALAPTSVSTGTTAAFDAPYAVGIAAVLLTTAGTGGNVWPSVSGWTNGFVQTDELAVGTGAGAAEDKLWIARYYGTAGETGPWETTATFSGAATTGKTAYSCIAVFRAEDENVADVGVILT